MCTYLCIFTEIMLPSWPARMQTHPTAHPTSALGVPAGQAARQAGQPGWRWPGQTASWPGASEGMGGPVAACSSGQLSGRPGHQDPAQLLHNAPLREQH